MTRLQAALVALLLALALAACGGNGEEGGADPAPQPPAEAVETVEEEPSEPPAEERADETEPPADTEAAAGGEREPAFSRLPGVTTAQAAGSIGTEELRLWRDAVPRASDVRIPSSADGTVQRAMWLPPGDEGIRPLLVVVHSWSSGYLQAASIPFARWADRHGWAMIAPDFRGPFNRPAATGSNLAVRDVLDAIDWTLRHGRVDRERVFVVGFSGGGMMSLLLAGRHPERFAGAVSWVPIHDLVDWYAFTRDRLPQSHYPGDIVASCGGDPAAGAEARRSCRHRSPVTHLDRARAAGIPVYIGHGLADEIVPPDHALSAFDQLAAPGDRVGRDAIQAARRNQLPARLRGSIEAETFFQGPDPPVVFARESGPVTVVLFEGTHDMVYHPGLEWMTRLAASR